MSRLTAWFRPTLLGLHAFALVAVGFCAAMGFWQLGVYDARQVDAVTERESNAPVSLTSVWGADDAFSGDLSALPVTITGRFASANQQFWVTPRLQGAVEGAWLIAPVLVDGTDSALLVVRGWAPAVGALPEVPVGEVTLTGVLQQGDSGSGAFEPTTRTIGSIRLPILINEVPFDLFSGYAVSSDPTMSAGLALAEIPSGDVSWTAGLRNLAYALQWWVFGAFALFMWWRMASESVAASRPKVI